MLVLCIGQSLKEYVDLAATFNIGGVMKAHLTYARQKSMSN